MVSHTLSIHHNCFSIWNYWDLHKLVFGVYLDFWDKSASASEIVRSLKPRPSPETAGPQTCGVTWVCTQNTCSLLWRVSIFYNQCTLNWNTNKSWKDCVISAVAVTGTSQENRREWIGYCLPNNGMIQNMDNCNTLKQEQPTAKRRKTEQNGVCCSRKREKKWEFPLGCVYIPAGCVVFSMRFTRG